MIVEGVRIAGRGELVDIEVDKGRIADIRVSAEPAAADGGTTRIALSGFVDLHTHLREPGGENAETIASGTRAAAAGGFSDVFAMPNTIPATDTVARFDEMVRLGAARSVRVHPIAAATLDRAGQVVVDVESLRAAGAVLFSDDGGCVWRDDIVLELMSRLQAVGGVFAQHAQDPAIVKDGVINERVAERVGAAPWPAAGEERIVARDIEISRRTGASLHVCHVSTAGSVELIRRAKAEGVRVTAEVTPHHLVLTDDDAAERGPALKVNPPLRAPNDALALREALRDGTIDVVGTDHAPHPAATKAHPWASAAFGLTALETALPIVAEALADTHGAVEWLRVEQVMSTIPARIGRIDEIAGRPLAVGEPATFCVIESGGTWPVHGPEHLSLSDNTPFEGAILRHRVILTLIGGRVVHDTH